jgi:glycosyltransferase involved in cell wall biosynthesis
VLLSQAEAFGLVLTESLACGTPVLASPGGGADEIVEGDRVGSLIDSDSPEAVASAMSESMDAGEEIRSGCIARAGEFSADRCAESYEMLYKQLT